MFSFKKIGISAAAAAILATGILGAQGFSSSAEAAKLPKSAVCHYQDVDKILIDEFGNESIDPLGWRVINISNNALDAHLGDGLEHPGHGDGVNMDDLLVDVGTEQDCLDRNIA